MAIHKYKVLVCFRKPEKVEYEIFAADEKQAEEIARYRVSQERRDYLELSHFESKVIGDK